MAAVRKDTRLQWFGSVPEHWKVARNKNAFRVVNKAVGDRFAEFDLLSLTLQGVKLRDIESGKGKFPASFETYQEVLPGDIVLCLFDIDETPRTVGLSHHKGMVTGAYTVVRCSDLADPRYVTYFYLSIDQRKGLRPFYTGLRKVVRTDTFLNASFPLPNLDTQSAIADFLDRETARIDQLIEKKQRLVGLLAERRERIIDQLSTNGLQGDAVEKKDTGFDWLGKVPKHWTIEKLAWHFTAEKGRDAQKYTKEYCGLFPGPYPVYSGQTANEGVMGTIDSFDYDYGDQGVLFSTTVGAKAMTVAHLTKKFSLSQNCMIIVPISKALPIRYFYYLLQPLFRKERRLIPEHMQASFRVEDLHRYWIAMPPNEEAEQISKAIDAEVATLEPIHQKTQASIERLREFRAALITAAVTGQIDVETWGKSGHADRRLDQIEEEMSLREVRA